MKSERTGAALISEARQSPERWGHMASVNQTQGNLQKAIRSQPHAAAPTRWLLAPWPAGPTDALFRGLISLAEGNQGPSAGTFSGMVLEPGFRRTPLEMGRGPLRGPPSRALGTGRAASSRGLAALGPQPATTAPPPLPSFLSLPGPVPWTALPPCAHPCSSSRGPALHLCLQSYHRDKNWSISLTPRLSEQGWCRGH